MISTIALVWYALGISAAGFWGWQLGQPSLKRFVLCLVLGPHALFGYAVAEMVCRIERRKP